MSEITLTGGPKDGNTVEVEPGQLKVEADGCSYAYCEANGCYVYEGGEVEVAPTASEVKHAEKEQALFDAANEDDET